MSCLAIDKSNTLSVVRIMVMSDRRRWCPITGVETLPSCERRRVHVPALIWIKLGQPEFYVP